MRDQVVSTDKMSKLICLLENWFSHLLNVTTKLLTRELVFHIYLVYSTNTIRLKSSKFRTRNMICLNLFGLFFIVKALFAQLGTQDNQTNSWYSFN